MKAHKLVVYRHEGTESINHCVLVTAETDDAIQTVDQLLINLKTGITHWARNNEEGKETYAQSKDDMNIGDLLGCDLEQLAKSCPGIQSLQIDDSFDVAHDWTYDTSLCDELFEKELTEADVLAEFNNWIGNGNFSFPKNHKTNLKAVYEHDEWWVKDHASGATWSVHPADDDELDFEMISEGEFE